MGSTMTTEPARNADQQKGKGSAIDDKYTQKRRDRIMVLFDFLGRQIHR